MEKELYVYFEMVKIGIVLVQFLYDVVELFYCRSFVVIFIDLLENLENFDIFMQVVQYLCYNQYEVVLFYVFDKVIEYDFSFESCLVNLVDMEIGEWLKIQFLEVRKVYMDVICEYFYEIELCCMQYYVDFMVVDIVDGLQDVLMKYMLKCQKLY